MGMTPWSKMVCCLDPSMASGTGFVFIKLTENSIEVVDYGCISTKTDKTGWRADEELQLRYTELIDRLTLIGVDEVCSEFPHGSKSAMAGKKLAIVTSVIRAVCYMKRIPLHFYYQGDAKKNLTGTSLEMKDLVLISALKKYQRFGYRKPKTKKDAEATADALAVFDLHLSKTHKELYKRVF